MEIYLTGRVVKLSIKIIFKKIKKYLVYNLEIPYRLEKLSTKLWLWAARQVPKKLVYWILIHVGAKTTTGKYSNTIVPEMTFMDALDRWEKI